MPGALHHLGVMGWVEPAPLLVNIAPALLYLAVTNGRFARRLPGRRAGSARQKVAFLAALACIYLSFGGPLDVLADGYLYSAHMVQHLLESFVAAPLLLVGTPAWLLRPLLRWHPTRVLLTAGTRPLVAQAAFTVVMALVIMPPVYAWIETDAIVHFAYHALLLVTALGYWWAIVSPVPEQPAAHPGLAMLYCTIISLPMIGLFAPILLDTRPYYPFYDHVPRVFGLTQVADQQLGAAIMLVGMHLPTGIAFRTSFRRWTQTDKVGEIDPVPNIGDGRGFRRETSGARPGYRTSGGPVGMSSYGDDQCPEGLSPIVLHSDGPSPGTSGLTPTAIPGA